jgi:Membrane protease subunits, stomatin/prohibitin homologs
MGNRTSL